MMSRSRRAGVEAVSQVCRINLGVQWFTWTERRAESAIQNLLDLYGWYSLPLLQAVDLLTPQGVMTGNEPQRVAS
jgi:hypothetical protein